MLHERELPDEASERAADTAADPVTLMSRYCDGDRRAFDEIYASLAPHILGYLTGLAKDRPTAEDLLQQTFINLHRHRDVYVRGANPVPWLFTIAHRTFLDGVGPASRRQAVRLIEIEGRTTAGAATMLGKTVGAIKVRAHRGYVALRRKLRTAPEDDGERS
jgi:RNA polymerase sigma-70 factor (ECF subfamily)